MLMSQDKSVLKIIFIIHAFKLMDKKKSNNFMPKCLTYLELWRSLKAMAFRVANRLAQWLYELKSLPTSVVC